MFIVSLSCKLLHTILLFGVWRVCSTEAELTKHLCHLVNGNKRYYKWKLKQKYSKILQIFGFVTSPNCRSWTVGGDNDWESLELKSDSKNSFFNYLHCVFRMGMNHTKKVFFFELKWDELKQWAAYFYKQNDCYRWIRLVPYLVEQDWDSDSVMNPESSPSHPLLLSLNVSDAFS